MESRTYKFTEIDRKNVEKIGKLIDQITNNKNKKK